jgi:PadR family transcriptional regulator PadR
VKSSSAGKREDGFTIFAPASSSFFCMAARSVEQITSNSPRDAAGFLVVINQNYLDPTARFARHSPKHSMGRHTDKADLLQGTLDLLILKTLTRNEMHGYEISESIQTNSEEALSIEEGALYPALHRLESRGLLSSRWDSSANNRRAKYYRLTSAGRKRLTEATEAWRRTSIAVNRILEST